MKTTNLLLRASPRPGARLRPSARLLLPAGLLPCAALLLGAGLLLWSGPALAETLVPAGQIVDQDWTASGSPYLIQGDVDVPAASTLTISAGVTVRFTGHYKLTVHGLLRAFGAEGDSVRFTSDPVENPAGWYGIRFLTSAEDCRLEYCVIERGSAGGGLFNSGGGVYCDESSPDFLHCAIRLNSATWDGGGVYCTYSSPIFTSCEISHNSAGAGGGVATFHDASPNFSYCTISNNSATNGGGFWSENNCGPDFLHCTISNNTATAGGGGMFCYVDNTDLSPYFFNCQITGNVTSTEGGGAVFCLYSSPGFTDCTFSGNTATSGNGGAVHCEMEDSAPTFRDCFIYDNTAGANGGGVDCVSGSTPTFINCLIRDNTASGQGGGVRSIHTDTAPEYIHCTINGNSAGSGDNVLCGNLSAPIFTSTVISYSGGEGVRFTNSQSSTFQFCNIYGNAGGNIVNPLEGPPWLYQPWGTNVNGDPCDSLANVMQNPGYLDLATLDFDLADSSSCIGAGSPFTGLDEDIEGSDRGHPPDIGAYENEACDYPIWNLSGPTGSRTLGPGTYPVVGHLSVLAGDTLRLNPGTIFDFEGPYRLDIEGTLLAEGTEADFITFTTDTIANPGRWRGLRFLPGSSESRLTWCCIENGHATGSGNQRYGGGVYCEGSSPTFTCCAILNNLADLSGGGVFCQLEAGPVFSCCTLSGNQAFFNGGGVFSLNAFPTFMDNCQIIENSASECGGGVAGYGMFENCIIRGNTAGGDGGGACGGGDFMDCLIRDNTAGAAGGGVYGWGTYSECTIRENIAIDGGGMSGDGTFEHCVINSNLAVSNGGGAYCADWVAPYFSRCKIDSNTAVGDGGGVFCIEWSFPYFLNCAITENSAGNNGGGLFCNTGQPTTDDPNFIHCTFSGNTVSSGLGGGIYCNDSRLLLDSSIVAFSTGEGIHFVDSAASSVWYNDFFGNSGGDIGFDMGWSFNGPPGIGVIVGTNSNGDPCDNRFNIYLDPAFADAPEGDFHLTEGSACIDAARPGWTDFDLDGNVRPDTTSYLPDIGAYEYSSAVTSVVEGENVPPPAEFAVTQNYPNPFNPVTRIEYALPENCRVRLSVYNARGQRVAILVNGEQTAGHKTVTWDASGLASGIYFYRLRAGDFTAGGKMVLLK